MMKNSETLTGSSGLASMRMEKPSLMVGMFLALGQGMVVGIGMTVARGLLNLSTVPAMLILFPIIILFMNVSNKIIGRRSKKSVGLILASDPDPRSNIRTATEWLISHSPKLQPISVMTRAMGKIGRVGKTYQLWWKAEPDPIEPLTMVFEPRLLDEADVGFDELAVATASDPEPSEANEPESPGWREDVLDMRRVQRNIRLKGGKLMLVGGILTLAFAIVDALQRHTVTGFLLFMVVAFLALLFGPTQGGWFATNHWLLVPGGVLHRKAKRRDRKVTLHLFDRRRSIMTIYQQRNSGVWLLTVADAEDSETTTITDRERQLLLRAWLSPVEPPPLERLVDLS